jgi:phosphoribosylanthranilate isomerase
MHEIEAQQPQIKICGIFRPEDTGVLNETLPDYAGFVFAEKSHRCVTAAQAKALRGMIDPRITTVGVFVDADPGFIIDLVREGTIGAVQLHGHEDAAYVRRLKAQLQEIGADGQAVPIFQAVTVNRVENAEGRFVPAVSPDADRILFDNGAGGTGKTFDHGVIREAAENGTLTESPFFIAGGLNAENISEVLALMQSVTAADPHARFFGVDVSGGVETNGVKDPEKIRRFVNAVRQAKNRKCEV